MKKVIKYQIGEILLQSKGYINKDWVLLDSQSTVYLFCNALMITNIRKLYYYLNIFYNTGSIRMNMVGELDRIWHSMVLYKQHSQHALAILRRRTISRDLRWSKRKFLPRVETR